MFIKRPINTTSKKKKKTKVHSSLGWGINVQSVVVKFPTPTIYVYNNLGLIIRYVCLCESDWEMSRTIICVCQSKYAAFVAFFLVRYLQFDKNVPQMSVIPSKVGDLPTQNSICTQKVIWLQSLPCGIIL